MAPWPFGRKKKKTKSDNFNEKQAQRSFEKMSGSSIGPQAPRLVSTVPLSSRNPVRQEHAINTSTLRHSEPKKLRKERQDYRKFKARTISQGPEVAPSESGRILGSGTQTVPYPSNSARLADNAPVRRQTYQYYGRANNSTSYQNAAASQSSIGPENFTALPRPPSLRAKRSSPEQMLPRRKSSKRKAEDYAREQEIKALCRYTPQPKRSGSRIFRRASRKFRTEMDQPTSDISLPPPDESMHSSASGLSEGLGFKVSTLDILAPCPTIKYTENPRYVPPRSAEPSRSSVRRDKRPMYTQSTIKESKRIDDLAEEMDTESLREIMDRDRRRRERKRRSDQERLHEKLQRRADKQRREEAEAGLASGSEMVQRSTGPDLDAPSPSKAGRAFYNQREREDVRMESPTSSRKDSERGQSISDDPFTDNSMATGPSRAELPEPIIEEQPMEPVQPVPSIPSTFSPPTPPPTQPQMSNIPHIFNSARDDTPDIPEHSELDSVGSGSKRGSENSFKPTRWASFFRRSSRKNKRTTRDQRFTPEFQNTTPRDSVKGQPLPAHLTGVNYRTVSNAPRRTLSKFREDLPELPLSPPDSRMQSPEAVPIPIPMNPDYRIERNSSSLADNMSIDQPLGSRDPFQDPMSGSASRHRSVETPDPALLSQSLASVDSEGSWLSGRPMKRSSLSSAQALRSSAGSLQRLKRMSDGQDSDNVLDDDYFRRLTPGPDQWNAPEHATDTKRASSNLLSHENSEAEDDMIPRTDPDAAGTSWHVSIERKPTLVKHTARVKSVEGLLNMVESGDGSSPPAPQLESTGGDSPDSPETPSPTPEGGWVHRATSIDYGKGKRGHARKISAGSAKLLELPPRTSVESKKMSIESTTPEKNQRRHSGAPLAEVNPPNVKQGQPTSK
ncbi:MAG: hypothetical protein M1834_001607 [Cirrosporium novae-zelandiae]|nr:MAG: hypothetical protein M1834_004124 [Cirrosporium novae-zelandiae]KAI9735591.1 MAG: hypothetical protein M1834_001607 [Cirrosporium novae-zelandiae]